MTENKFNITCKIKGCKIKSKISGYIETNYPEMAQGQDDFKVKMHLEFEAGDVPSELTVILTPSGGFETPEPQILKPVDQNLEFELPFSYIDAPVGYYTIEGELLHDEYGTELGKVDASYFYLKVPEMKIERCNAQPDVVRTGDKFQVRVVLKTTSPQKIKGTVSGKLKPSGDTTSARVYELMAQKISVKAEREVMWELKVPKDEENIASYNGQFKFESKETGAEAIFEDILKLKRNRDIQVILLEPDTPVASPADDVTFKCKLKNIGIEPAEISAKMTLEAPGDEKVALDIKHIELGPDEDSESTWIWQIPSDAINGFYQYGIEWEFANTGETDAMPGNTIEVLPRHHIEITSASTDKDYYLSGQTVRFNIVIIDNGTRAGKESLDIHYKITAPKGDELHKGSLEVKDKTSGSELTAEWTLPSDLESGALDFQLSVSSGGEELTDRKFPKLINVEQPVSLKFNLIQSSIVTHPKNIDKYVLDGEYRITEETYHDLNIIHMSSETQLVFHGSKLVGGIAWHKIDRDAKRAAEDLIFSNLLLTYALNAESLKELRSQWNELGAIWTSKLKNAVLNLSKDTTESLKLPDHEVVGGGSDLHAELQSHNAFRKLKSYIARPEKDPSSWQEFVQPLLAPVNFVDYKTLAGIIEKIYDDKFGKSILGITLEYLEYGKISSSGKLAEVMNEFIKTLYSKVTTHSTKNADSISKSLEGWYTYFKNVKIDLEHDPVISDLINIIYSISALKFITRIINVFDSMLVENRVTRMDYVKHTFSLFAYHMLNIEFQQKTIRYNEFMNEELSKNELSQQFQLVDDLAVEHETIVGRVMRFFHNYLQNMEMRKKWALIRNNVKLISKTGVMNGFMGENIRHNLEFTNHSRKPLKFNLIFSFPSSDWHVLEPECNLIDGVYWHENLFIQAGKNYKMDMSVAFPKSLSYQDYKCLLKLEPISIKLLKER